MAAISDPHLGLAASCAYHRIHMRHLACKASSATKQCKFNRNKATIGRINSEAQQWLEAIPLKI